MVCFSTEEPLCELLPEELFGCCVCVMDEEALGMVGEEIPQGMTLHPATFLVLWLAIHSVLLHSRAKPSPFVTLSDCYRISFICGLWLGLLPLFVSPEIRKDSALSIPASSLEGGVGYYRSRSVNSSSDFIILSI